MRRYFPPPTTTTVPSPSLLLPRAYLYDTVIHRLSEITMTNRSNFGCNSCAASVVSRPKRRTSAQRVSVVFRKHSWRKNRQSSVPVVGAEAARAVIKEGCLFPRHILAISWELSPRGPQNWIRVTLIYQPEGSGILAGVKFNTEREFVFFLTFSVLLFLFLSHEFNEGCWCWVVRVMILFKGFICFYISAYLIFLYIFSLTRPSRYPPVETKATG